MSVMITNISQDHGIPYGSGKQIYVVSINYRKFFGEFEHTSEDGLAECLRKAADCVELHEERKQVDEDSS